MALNERVHDLRHRDAEGDRSELVALACIDLESGMIVSTATREEEIGDTLDAAAAAATDLCSAARLRAARPEGAPGEDAGALDDEGLVVGSRFVHALVHPEARTDLVLVGVGLRTASPGLVLACAQEAARRIAVAR